MKTMAQRGRPRGNHTREYYDTREFDSIEEAMQQATDRALVAAAFTIRDRMRQEYIASKNLYTKNTDRYDELAQGIMVGKLKSGEIKIHGMGKYDKSGKDNTWKTRFFIGGTIPRQDRGMIAKNEAVDKGMRDAERILTEYINNATDNI